MLPPSSGISGSEIKDIRRPGGEMWSVLYDVTVRRDRTPWSVARDGGRHDGREDEGQIGVAVRVSGAWSVKRNWAL